MILIGLTAVAFLTAAAAGLIIGVVLSLRYLTKVSDSITLGDSEDWWI